MMKFNPKNFNKGQSIIEYMLLLAVVVVALIAFLKPSGGPYRNKLERLVNGPVGQLEDMANNLPFPK